MNALFNDSTKGRSWQTRMLEPAMISRVTASIVIIAITASLILSAFAACLSFITAYENNRADRVVKAQVEPKSDEDLLKEKIFAGLLERANRMERE